MATPTPNPNAHAHLPPVPVPVPVPAPRLSGDARLLLSVHHSVPSPPLHEPYGDSERLAALGRRQLGAAYAQAVARARPDLVGPGALQAHIDAAFPAFVDRWVTAYGWRLALFGVPPGTDLGAPTETRRIFDTYAGAVAVQPDLGPLVLMQWIEQLVNAP
ncbi:hypothetical protein C8T65DRAFT_831605 [Cerioporus squamosus]|nr:hypothetical protein C8T65DRAFT_831605 [Cerioporus squamosus]